MSIRWFIGLALLWVIAHGILAGVITGVMYGDSEIALGNNMTETKYTESQDIFAMPAIGKQWFEDSWNLMSFHYPFLTGGFAFLRIVFSAISIGVVFGFIQVFAPALMGMVGSLLRLGR